MIKLKVYNLDGQAVGDLELAEKIFGLAMKPKVVQQAVVAQQANSRVNIAHTKDRSEVRGGGIKPWRQKGTGRARQGSIRSPLWIGGGITFGPRKNRNFTLKINKQVRRQALFMALSDKVRSEKIIVLDQFSLPAGKTKQLSAILKKLPVKSGKTLLSLAKKDSAIIQAARNLKRIGFIAADSLNVVDVLSYQYLVMDKAAIALVQTVYKNI